jgi:hypothetical protein
MDKIDLRASMQQTPGNLGVVGAPWVIDRDNEHGITVKDDRGYIVWNENWFDVREAVGRVPAAKIMAEVRARVHATVEVINAHQKLVREHREMLAALKAIMRATIEGKVCDDVAWFDQITTLHDFCGQIVDAVQPSATQEDIEDNAP